MVTPPRDEAELISRVDDLAGRTLREVASAARLRVPAGPGAATKGWPGQLLEAALGATAGGRAAPDFPGLGVELKTVPVDAAGRPRESTFVCVAPLDVVALGDWEGSWVRRKLSRVLWVPLVVADPLPDTLVGGARLWSPSPAEAALLRADFDELRALLAEGALARLDARVGAALQLRPKAADATPAAWATDEDGERVRTVARGFYLRPSFTAAILAG
jgi:DNA mismatch repair protein MutH